MSRAVKTIDKLKRGGLPLCTYDVRARLESGDGRTCDCCGEPISQVERMYVFEIHDVVLHCRLVCYNAWVMFKRLSSPGRRQIAVDSRQ